MATLKGRRPGCHQVPPPKLWPSTAAAQGTLRWRHNAPFSAALCMPCAPMISGMRAPEHSFKLMKGMPFLLALAIECCRLREAILAEEDPMALKSAA